MSRTQATRMSRGIKSVTVEYDKGTQRVRKTMSDGAARRFYCQKLADGKNPKIVAADR